MVTRQYVLHGYVGVCEFGDGAVFKAPVYAVNLADAEDRTRRALANTYTENQIRKRGDVDIKVYRLREYKKRYENDSEI